jgi:hypothetical protein
MPIPPATKTSGLDLDLGSHRKFDQRALEGAVSNAGAKSDHAALGWRSDG